MSATLYAKQNRRGFFHDKHGTPSRIQHKDETRQLLIDYENREEYSGTISTATWTANGVTKGANTETGHTTYADITGTNGYVEITMEDSAGHKFVDTVRFYAPSDGRRASDYGNN